MSATLYHFFLIPENLFLGFKKIIFEFYIINIAF